MEKSDLVVFNDENLGLEVKVDKDNETVWLTQKQMELLFDVSHATISEHIANVFSEGELFEETSVGFSDKSSGGRKAKIFNLDVIISVGYRVKSKRGIAFRKWVNNILKKYIRGLCS